jgi:hypothetical protein
MKIKEIIEYKYSLLTKNLQEQKIRSFIPILAKSREKY